MATYILARNCWLIVLRGFAAVLFGLGAFIWSTPGLAGMCFSLGLYLFTDGLLAASTGLSRYNGCQPWRLLLVNGLLGMSTGLLLFITPRLTALTVVYLIAVWAMTTGLVELVSALRLRSELNNEGFLALSGAASLSLGGVLVIWPEAATTGLVWMFGIYVLTFGLLLIGLGLQLWDWQRAAGPTPLYVEPGLQRHRVIPSQVQEGIRMRSQ